MRVQHLPDLHYRAGIVLLATVGRVEVLDDLPEVVGHALQLRVQRPRQLGGNSIDI